MFWIVLFAALSSASFACDNPPLAPAVPDPGGLSQEQRQAVQQEVGAYYEAVKVYTACLEAEIATARGDDAPRYRSELTLRNNAAVAEAVAVLKALEKYVPLPANQGSEAALRRTIDELAQGTLNYDLIAPEIAATMRRSEAVVRRELLSFGRFESATFLSRNAREADVYLVKFADGVTMWEIGLTAEGKTSWINMQVCREGGRLVDPRSVRRCSRQTAASSN